jgi:hypothetical protein
MILSSAHSKRESRLHLLRYFLETLEFSALGYSKHFTFLRCILDYCKFVIYYIVVGASPRHSIESSWWGLIHFDLAICLLMRSKNCSYVVLVYLFDLVLIHLVYELLVLRLSIANGRHIVCLNLLTLPKWQLVLLLVGLVGVERWLLG